MVYLKERLWKKIVFSDIDRTLALSGVVSDKNKEFIKKYVKPGNNFVLVSGRVIDYTSKIAKEILQVIMWFVQMVVLFTII